MQPSERNKFIEKVVQHLADIDPLAQVVIKCHLLWKKPDQWKFFWWRTIRVTQWQFA
jgi:hypothetical protein